MREPYCCHCGNLLDDKTPIPGRCTICLKLRLREHRYNTVTGERLQPEPAPKPATFQINKYGPVKISGELQVTEYGQTLFAQQFLERHQNTDAPDAIYAEYTNDSGVKYAGVLYRAQPTKEQE